MQDEARQSHRQASEGAVASQSRPVVVAGHDPQVADRFKPVEPGIIKIA